MTESRPNIIFIITDQQRYDTIRALGYDYMDTPQLDRLISEETGLPVIVAEDPLTCVARGGGKAMELMDRRTMDLLSTE